MKNKINNFTKSLLWLCYYILDRLRCAPLQKKVGQIDTNIVKELSKIISEKKLRKIIIFSCYEKDITDEYINHFLKNVEDIFVIFINNTEKKEYGLTHVENNFLWIDRPNYARDVGGYKVGISAAVLSKNHILEDISFTNDSVYILRSDFYDFFRKKFSEDIMGHSYSVKPYPHVRSYLFRIKASVAPRLNKYLSTLPLAKSRYNAVKNGEIGMSKKVFLKSKIGLWVYNGTFKDEYSSDKVSTLDTLQSDMVGNMKFTEIDKAISIAEEAKPRIYLKNFLSDPYEFTRNSPNYKPHLIKREVFEKGLASKEQVFYSVQNSDLPINAQKQILTNILISKRHIGIKVRIKMAIGEI